MKNPGSNFVTPAGLILLAVLTLVSAYLRIRGLEALLIALLLLCLAAFFWAKFALERIEVEIEDEDCRGFPGELMEAEARLCNRKFLPVIWLEARFPSSGAACVAPPEDEVEELEEGETPEIKERFLWVMPQQSIRWKQRVLAVRRGVCRLDCMELVSGDGFGLADKRKKAPLPTGFRFIVYPEIRPVDVSPILSSMSEMEKYRRGIYTDNTLINNIRDYRDGDSFRDINWRLLARQGKVQVNVHEKLAMRRICLVPDLESFMYLKEEDTNGERRMTPAVHEEDMERMFSLIASIIVGVHERGVLCSLMIPAIGDIPARLIAPEHQETQVMELLTALAETEYCGEKTALSADEILGAPYRLGQLFLFSRTLPAGGDGLAGCLEDMSLMRVVQNDGGGKASVLRQVIKETELVSA